MSEDAPTNPREGSGRSRPLLTLLCAMFPCLGVLHMALGAVGGWKPSSGVGMFGVEPPVAVVGCREEDFEACDVALVAPQRRADGAAWAVVAVHAADA